MKPATKNIALLILLQLILQLHGVHKKYTDLIIRP